MRYVATYRWTAVGLLFLAGCYRPSLAPAPDAMFDRLLHAMEQRLLLMHDVARWKWNEKQAISDPQREQTFLKGMEAKAQTAGLNQAFVRSFFQAQIEAAKQMQEDDFQRWQAVGQSKFTNVPDLPTQQRGRIDAASNDLLAALEAAQPILTSAEGRRRLVVRAALLLSGDGITDRVRHTALEPLLSPP